MGISILENLFDVKIASTNRFDVKMAQNVSQRRSNVLADLAF